MYISIPSLTFLLRLLPFSFFSPEQQPLPVSPQLTFSLAAAHGTAVLSNSQPLTLFQTQSQPAFAPPPRIRTRPTRVFRPRSQEDYQAARQRSRLYGQSEKVPWDEDVVLGPDITDRETLLELAKMTSNAYTMPGASDWYDLGGTWNNSQPFGWEPDQDGFRGHIFVSNSTPPTVILSIKGTNLGLVPGGGGPTTKKDKLNDNLLFSCCCAYVNWRWPTVCDCYSGGWRCDQGCLQKALTEESLFYPIGTNLYNNVTYMYPDANIWVIGHSLGGSISGLLGLTFGAPVVAFEAPADRLPSSRLHLPLPPSDEHITHIFNTADPIAMGECNGASTCATFGYAMESKCHNGLTVLYDTITKRGWSSHVGQHRISMLIDYLLAEPWEEGKEVPDPERQTDCVECFKWDFGDYKDKNASLAVS